MRRVAVVAAAAAAAAGAPVASSPAADAAGELAVYFVSVGQGDGTVYVGPCGDAGVIDVNAGGVGEVDAQLDALGVTALEWIAVSHYDADHLGDVVDLAQRHAPERVYDRGGDRTVKDTETYRDYYDWVTSVPGRRQPLDIGERFSLCGDVVFSVVSAGTDGSAVDGLPVSEENDRGLCLKVEYMQLDIATCGDINGSPDGARSDVETAVADNLGDVEIVKVNHHGSAYSSNPTFVGTLQAQAAVVSVGPNSYGHPSPTVLARWDATGDVWRTDTDGTVVIRYAGGSTFTTGTATRPPTTYAVDEGEAAAPSARDIADACPPDVVEEDGFADVSASNVHESAVDCVAWYEITGGTAAGRYSPAGTVSRGQMATFILRLVDKYLDVPTAPPDAFDDDNGTAHEANTNRLAAMGVVTGTGDRRFSPGAPVTRGQMATFLLNAIDQYGIALTGPDRFGDDSDHTHEESINAVAGEGIAGGTTATTYNPDHPVARDQMASFIARTLDLLVEQNGRPVDTTPPARCPYDASLPATHSLCQPPTPTTTSSTTSCHPSYPDFCIPPPPPELDCGDLAGRAGAHPNFPVAGPDAHGFDSDGDGRGCEGGL